MVRLQYIVATRRWKMVDHIFRLQKERPAHNAMYRVPENGRRKSEAEEDMAEYIPRGPGMEPTGSPVTVIVDQCFERNR